MFVSPVAISDEAFGSMNDWASRLQILYVNSTTRPWRVHSKCQEGISKCCTWRLQTLPVECSSIWCNGCDPCSTGEPYPALNHVGITRLAFRVSDINATTAAMRERGVVFLTEEPQSFGPIRTIVTSDPDGVFI